MSNKTLVLDVDDCLYPAGCGLHEEIKERIKNAAPSGFIVPGMDLDDHGHIVNFPQVVRDLYLSDKAMLTDFLFYVYNVDYRQIPKDPDLVNSLLRFNGRKTIYTSGPYFPHVLDVLDRLDLGLIFFYCSIVDMFKSGPNLKPSPEGYAACCELLNVSPEDTIYLDDGLKNLHGAKTFHPGVTTVWVNHAGHELNPNLHAPDHITDNVAEFINSLE